MRIGSLFSGAGGLDLAALDLFDDPSIAWHCEVDPAASKVLAHHWPNVPNLGDVTQIEWAAVEPVDVLVGGFPCQDVSAAGHRRGLHAGTRSGLWSHMCGAIEALRPKLVLIENVRGLLNAPAVRDMESRTDDVGDNNPKPVLRAIGAVLGSLADVGFDAEWTVLRASAVGLCHHRARVFILAYPSDTNLARPQGPSKPADTGATTPLQQGHAARHGRQAPAVLPTPSVADGTGGHETRSGVRRAELLLPGLVRAVVNGDLLPTPRSSDGEKGGPNQRGSAGDRMLPSAVVHWGDFESAIRRQERLTRPAPEPTQRNAKGQHRLSPAFSEWMMTWPSGWATDPAIGLTRIEKLRVIGNGVIPVQAGTAYRRLFAMREVVG